MPGVTAYAHLPLNEKEKLVITCALQCLPELPKPDMDRLAKMTGYASAASANYAWGVIKAKLKYMADNGISAESDKPGPSTPKSAKKTNKRKNKNVDDDDDDDDEEAIEPPRKKKSPAKKAAGKTDKVKAEPVDDENGDDTDFLDKVLTRHDSAEEA